jgi:hypothetical protein
VSLEETDNHQYREERIDTRDYGCALISHYASARVTKRGLSMAVPSRGAHRLHRILVIREPDFIKEFIYDTSQEEKAMMLSPSHDVVPGINMLRTCRQVYHEAVGILYSSNSFTISVDLHRHNRTMQQLDTAANFVHRLGSQAALLKNVNIDINPLCSPMCVEHPYDDDE